MYIYIYIYIYIYMFNFIMEQIKLQCLCSVLWYQKMQVEQVKKN